MPPPGAPHASRLESIDPRTIGVDAARFQFKANADERGQIWRPTLTQTTASGVRNSGGSAVGASVRWPRTDVPRSRIKSDGTMNNGLLPNPPTYG